MELPVDPLEPGGVHMRVDLRGGNARVAKHLLDLPQVGSAGEHVRGETVP